MIASLWRKRLHRPEALRLLLGDTIRIRHHRVSLSRHVGEAAQWLLRAQQATPDDGVSGGYSFEDGWIASYPETTGLALLGLQGHVNLGPSLDLAAKLAEDRASPLARAWLTIALRVHGAKTPDDPAGRLPVDLHEVALEALAAPEGNHRFFKTEVLG